MKMTCWVAASVQPKKVGLNRVVIFIEGFVDAYTLQCFATVDLSSFTVTSKSLNDFPDSQGSKTTTVMTSKGLERRWKEPRSRSLVDKSTDLEKLPYTIESF